MLKTKSFYSNLYCNNKEPITIIHLGRLDLGNNYTFEHLFNAVVSDLKTDILNILELNQVYILIFNTNYGRGKIFMNGYTLNDSLK